MDPVHGTRTMRKNLVRNLMVLAVTGVMTAAGSMMSFAGVEHDMLADLYQGTLASESGTYTTQAAYPLDQCHEWKMKAKISYFHSIDPGPFILHPEGAGMRVEMTVPNVAQVRQQEAEYDAKIQELVAQTAGMTKDAEIRFFRDYLVANCEYDYGQTSSLPYDCLIRGKSVCQGYTSVMCNLCHEAGIECEYLSGTVTYGGQVMSHSWNRVKLDDGQWYYVDVTLDDTTDSYNYLLVSEEQMNQDHTPDRFIEY